MKRARRWAVAAMATAVTMAASLAMTAPAGAQATGEVSASAKPAAASPASAATPAGDEAVLATLQNTVVDVDYDRVDFEKVIQDLRERYGLNVHVLWTPLEAAGVRRDQRVEVQLKRVTLETMLNVLLGEAGASAKRALTYSVENGVLTISTGERAREQRVLRTYDISDLLESGYAIRRFANTPVLRLETTGYEFVGGEDRKPAAEGGEGKGGGSLFVGAGEEASRPSAMERVHQIVDLIQENVDPEGWRDMGGDTGGLQEFGGTLFVQQTLRNHQRITEFLETLRSSRPQALDADAAVIRLRADKAASIRKEIGAAFPRLTAEQADKLAMSAAAEGVLFRATASGFNGRGMFFSALTQRDVLSTMNPVVGDQISAFKPVSTAATAGLELILLPLLSPKSDRLTIDVQMAWVPQTKVEARPVGLSPSPSPNAATIDQSQRSMRTVSGAASVQLGQAIVYSIPAQLNDQGAAAEWEDWLVVRVRKPGA